jgi:4a-hydroxytetrahydrobiopterin dehydratase
MRDLLGKREIDDFCSAGSRWERHDDDLVGIATAVSFTAAIAWVNQIAEAAEEFNHHPDIDIRWCTLTLRLSTHSSGGLTDLDLLLADRIDAIVDAADHHSMGDTAR